MITNREPFGDFGKGIYRLALGIMGCEVGIDR